MMLGLRLNSLRACLPKMAADAFIFSIAFILAFQVRLTAGRAAWSPAILLLLLFIVPLKMSVFHYCGAYRSIWRYSSISDLGNLVRASLLSGLALLGLGFLLGPEVFLPRSVPFIDAAFTVLLAGGIRMTTRLLHDSSWPEAWTGSRVYRQLLRSTTPGDVVTALIVGAGDAGEMIVREMKRSMRSHYYPAAFVDDDPSKIGQSIHGVPVLGSRHDIPRLVTDNNIDEILIAMPSADGPTVREIVSICDNTTADLKILPDMGKIVNGKVGIADLRRIRVDDLLGREQVELNLSMISAYIRGKRVLVTGAGGSIGSELCRQILRFGPSEIHLMGRGENSIYEIHRELAGSAGFTRLVQVIGDVINKKKVEGVFAMHRPHIVFHAAADKHVPLMEMNPDEAVLNNIIGTKNILEVGNEYRAERIVCVSTDKAVNPSSVMGCCKRVAELLIRSNLYSDTVAVAVRFGNVLGSRGSVIPLFQKQIEAGGPLTVTSREVIRYFMTIPEAVGLIMQAGAMGKGGEVFVLDMGEPIKIWHLATNMVRLAGLELGRDIRIEEVGLRPGEKLYEELHSDLEELEPTAHPKIMCIREQGVSAVDLLREIENLRDSALRMHYGGIRAALRRLVPEYRRAQEEEQDGEFAFAWGGRE